MGEETEGIFQTCVYTRLALEALEDGLARGGELEFEQGKRWVRAKNWVAEARKQGERLLVLFSGAEGYNEVAYVGAIVRVTLGARSSKVFVSHLRKLRRTVMLGSIVLASGRALSNGDLKTYKLCETPKKLRRKSVSDLLDDVSLLRPPGERWSWLLFWDPKRDDDFDLDKVEDGLRARKRPSYDWPIGKSRDILPGDRWYMTRCGSERRGVIASGVVLGSPDVVGGETRQAFLRFSQALGRDQEPFAVDAVRDSATRLVKWDKNVGALRLPSDAAKWLKAAWETHCEQERGAVPLAEAVEGQVEDRVTRHRRRERVLRAAKVTQVLRAKGRLRCEAAGCGFDFERVYGPLGRAFCEVHHRKSLSTRAAPSVTRLSDLAIVCSNCHAMIHRGGENRDLTKLIHRSKL